MWFDPKHIIYHEPIQIPDLQGYILPHASTAFTGPIISHCLRFRPSKPIRTIMIIYYPSSPKPNVNTDSPDPQTHQYHEYHVPQKCLETIFGSSSSSSDSITYINHNIKTHPRITNTADLYVLSIDFSHFLPLQTAITKENCAAHCIMHKQKTLPCMDVIDHVATLHAFNKHYRDANYQWCGRTRGESRNRSQNRNRGVGYLTFLIRHKPTPNRDIPDGFFVTAYDRTMKQRECLGNTTQWSPNLESQLIADVVQKAQTTSRLTGGRNKHIPVTHYTVTYLYKEINSSKSFIRGWHAISKDALYLPDVFLENTFDNGTWIKQSHTTWEAGNTFSMKETSEKLDQKANLQEASDTNYTLYSTHVMHRPVHSKRRPVYSKRRPVYSKRRQGGMRRSRKIYK